MQIALDCESKCRMYVNEKMNVILLAECTACNACGWKWEMKMILLAEWKKGKNENENENELVECRNQNAVQ